MSTSVYAQRLALTELIKPWCQGESRVTSASHGWHAKETEWMSTQTIGLDRRGEKIPVGLTNQVDFHVGMGYAE